MEAGRGGESIASRLVRRLAREHARTARCPVCKQPIFVDRHCVRSGDAFLHAHCALYRRRPARAA